MKINAINRIALVLLIPMFLPFVWWHSGSKTDAAFQISGIVATLIGTLWLAAGVYVSQPEVQVMLKAKPKKAMAMLIGGARNASHPLTIAVIYLFVGALLLIVPIVVGVLYP
ncbi:hypothetical protein [Stenotrophomonas sp. JAG2]|uniref:hypothetical protein n=1 Tax=Stenotrophomonas sp. JAG2 TaxID=3229243 RepID=UPI0034E1A22E